VFVNPQGTDTLELFRQTGAYLSGHFRLTSGLHSNEYLQCALVLQYPVHAEYLGWRLADAVRTLIEEPPAVVASPALGGLIIGHEVARELGARFVFTERDANSKMTLRRGFQVTPGESVVVIEDVVTTGGSTADVVAVMKAAGAQVLAAGSIIDRSGGRAEVGVPRSALATLQVETWDPAVCPLCAQGVPVLKPGSRPA
jgi:orotate phosphoribosyltransferase